MKFVLILNVANQEHEGKIFTVKKYRSSNKQRKRRISLVMNERIEWNVIRQPLHKNRALWEGLLILDRTRKQNCRSKKLNELYDCLNTFWKRRSKTGKWKLFQRLSWMNTDYINQFMFSIYVFNLCVLSALRCSSLKFSLLLLPRLIFRGFLHLNFSNFFNSSYMLFPAFCPVAHH